jgi:hypothetical protein
MMREEAGRVKREFIAALQTDERCCHPEFPARRGLAWPGPAS